MLVVKSYVELLRSCGINIPVMFPTSLCSVWSTNYLPLQISNLQQLVICTLKAMKRKAALELDILRCGYSRELDHSIFFAIGIPTLVT